MIQELKIKNFLSFKEEVVFSFETTKDTTFEDCQVVEVTPGVRLLRIALVYGSNASGKSNLLDAFHFLSTFWHAKPSDGDEATGAIPFVLDIKTPDLPSEFSLKFYVGSTRYWYVLKLDSKRVYSERLYFYNSVQPTLVFDRQLTDGQSVVRFNPAVARLSNAAIEELTLKCLPNMSVFAARNQVNIAVPKLDDARNWMRNRIMPPINPSVNMFAHAGRKIHENKDLKNHILDFVRRADFNITDVQTDRVAPNAPDSIRTVFEHTVKNIRGEEKYYLPTELQSAGTRRIFGIEAAVYEAVRNQAFLAIDEIEASLHPDLVEFVLEKFLQEKNNSQLLVATHYDPLLNTVDDLLRKDSIWFTEKDESGATSLYSLVEFKGLRKLKSLQKSYRNGIFGAVPSMH